MSKYADYNHLEIYNKKVLGEQTLEDRIEALRGKNYKYIVKTIKSGDMLESEIYPVYLKRQDSPQGEYKKPSKEVQDRLNKKNAKKEFVRMVNTNFTKDDLHITLTYKDKYLPTYKQAKKDITNYIRRLRRYLKKHKLPKLKYLYVLEYVDDADQHKSKKIRVHHHMIINKMDRNIAEDLWRMGRVEAKRLQPDEFGLEGIARYMMKQPKGKRSWVGSRNLKKPKVYRSVSRLSKRKAEIIAKQENEHPDLFENLYSNRYIFNDSNTFYSEIVGGFYLYCRMRRRN